MIHKQLSEDGKTTRSLIEEKLRTAKKTSSLSLSHFYLKAIPAEVKKS